jgi:MoaA/NifB/PqqE/SkfB family radical SAM enzyme
MVDRFELVIIPTRQCNLRCRYCPVEKSDARLSASAAGRAVSSYLMAGGRSVRLTGGEPLLAWDTVKEVVRTMAGHVAPEPAELEICTNGLLLGEKELAFLNRPWITLVVSMDGEVETCLNNRLGKKSVDKYLKLIDIVKEIQKKHPYFITQTVFPGSAKGAAENFFYLWGLGIRNFNILPVYYRIWERKDVNDLKKDLFSIATFLKPNIIDNKARLRNIERKGLIPLFGLAACLDADGRFYFTNAVLLKGLGKLRSALHMADRYEDIEKNLPRFLEGHAGVDIIRGTFSASVNRSNAQVDAVLTGFVREFDRPPVRRSRRTRAAGGRPERLELHLSYRCTNNCIFCSESHRLERFRGCEVETQEAWRVLVRHREAGGGHVNFTGGEPTLHPGFITLLGGARDLGLRTYVGTNGVMMGREDFARQAAPLIDELSLSIHGPEAAVHDACTRTPGSFAGIVRTGELAPALHPSIQLMANMVVTRLNEGHVVDTLRLCAGLGVRQMLLSNPSPEGRAGDRYREIVLPFHRWKKIAAEAARTADELGVTVRFFGLPACVLGGARTRSNDLFFDPRITVERARLGGGRVGLSTIITRYPRRGRRKVRACGGCTYNDLCGGIFRNHVKIYKDQDIEPVREEG